ncbi:hypothetical protein NDU88_010832 [Pleurodeles waltl]|uniref:Uncharacterized protein n=1 Tax=Pleurodeles waltl TaxID=8319 RepID=A0AAV7QXG3_PLEWA|nr:hypothetical protein NDU88_010832 [Pleurodeles waltl]
MLCSKSPTVKSVASLWNKPPTVDTKLPDHPATLDADALAVMLITQDYMGLFLQEICSQTESLKSDFKSCLQDLEGDVSEIGDRMDDLECTVDARSEDQEMLWCHLVTLEDQQTDLQAKQEDLEDRS